MFASFKIPTFLFRDVNLQGKMLRPECHSKRPSSFIIHAHTTFTPHSSCLLLWTMPAVVLLVIAEVFGSYVQRVRATGIERSTHSLRDTHLTPLPRTGVGVPP